MDGQVHSRGRGLKINGSARGAGHSKNRQWIAGQGTVGPREGLVGHNSDGERWERGNGHRRGRGRGRGSVWPSSHLSTPGVHGEATSGTEEESQDGMEDVSRMDDEESEAEVEEKGLDTPEEREKYYQEVRPPHSYDA